MQLTEVRISLCEEGSGRLKAYCSLTFDNEFVIRDVKLIEGDRTADGNSSRLFLAMPSRKLCDRCNRCGEKNHLRARFCNNCGRRLDDNRHLQHIHGNGIPRLKLHADIAHPIHAECRHDLERRVVEAYHEEVHRSHQPGYIRQRLDLEDGEFYDAPPRSPAAPVVPPPMARPAMDRQSVQAALH